MTPSRPGSITDRARSGVAVDPQDGLFDKVIDQDEDLVAALEERERMYAQRKDLNRLCKEADKAAKDLLEPYQLAVGEVARVGRFKIKRTPVAGREVEFTTAPTDRLTIGTIADPID